MHSRLIIKTIINYIKIKLIEIYDSDSPKYNLISFEIKNDNDKQNAID